MTPTQKLRAAVCRRAEGKCEQCKAWVGENGESGHLDHFFGRAKAAESVETCWLLCVRCDHNKTNNSPRAEEWLRAFARHCRRHGFTAEAERAESRLVFVRARAGVAA